VSGEGRQREVTHSRPGRRPPWAAIALVASLIAVLLAFPLAARVREPGPDSRPLGYTLLASLFIADLVIAVRQPSLWVRALALFAAAACVLAAGHAILQ
jgi:hypothetical protein